jgi:hypothetical protein
MDETIEAQSIELKELREELQQCKARLLHMEYSMNVKFKSVETLINLTKLRFGHVIDECMGLFKHTDENLDNLIASINEVNKYTNDNFNLIDEKLFAN